MNHQIVTRASEAAADKLCPGRAIAQKEAGKPPPEKEPNEYAEHGKAIHAALETANTDHLTQQQKEIYHQCVDITDKVLAKYFGAFNGHILREQTLSLSIDGHTHIGHPDAIYRQKGVALIPDYKSLRGEYAGASSNEQLRDYVCLYDLNTELLEEAATVIIQPLVTTNPEICIYDREAINRATAEMRQRVRSSHDVLAPRIAGDLQCQWCRAKRICKEYQERSSSRLPVPRTIVDVPVASWTPEQRVEFCEHRTAARKWLEDTEREMKRLLRDDPDSIPGWTLSDGAEQDVLTNIQVIYERAIALGIKHSEFMKTLEGVKIKGKLKEKLADATGAKGKELDKAIDALIAGASFKAKNEPSLKKAKK